MSLINASENLININSPDNSRASLFNPHLTFYPRQKSTFLTTNNQQNQAEKRDVLIKCINRIRQSTQVKSFQSLSEKQLQIVNDYGSFYSKNNPLKKEITKQETHFETSYYQSKLQAGKLRNIVLQYMDKINKKQEWSIKPSHPFMIFWNVLKLCFMVHIFILFPLIDAFGDKFNEILKKQEQFFLIEWIFLLFDIVLRFNVQIYQDGQLIKSHYILAQTYFKNGLIIDVLGIFGFSLFFFKDTLYLKYIYFLKINEIKKFIKFLRYEIDPQNKYNNHIKLITLFVTIFFLAHIIACLWIVSGQHQPSWIDRHELQDEKWIVQYLWAFYFAILTMTTVGYGDIVPVNTTELISCILIVLLSSAIFAYTLNTITTVLKDIDLNKSQYQEEARIIQSYMIKKGCDTDLQRRVQQYLKLMWKWGLSEKKQQEQIIFQKLSSHLQQEINLQDKGQMLLKLPFIVNNFNIDCVKQLMSTIEEVYYQPGEILTAQDGLYLLYKGQVDICWGSKINPKTICNLNPGDNYGLQNLFNINKSKYFLKSQNFSIFYFIPSQIMRKILKENDNETFCMINDQVINENYQNLYLICNLCKKEGHSVCQEILFKPNKAITIAKYNKNQYQERKQFRRNLSKCQILKNLKNRQIETCQFIHDKKDFMILKFKQIFDSEDIDDDPESIELQSSQSFKFDSEQMDEQITQNHPDRSPYLKQQSFSKRASYQKKQTMLMPQEAIAGFFRRNTQEISINLTQIQPNEIQQEQQQTQVNSNIDGNTPKSKEKQYNIDIMKSFNRYFIKYNYGNVIRYINQQKRAIKKRIKRLDRF